MKLPFIFKLVFNRYFFEKLSALALLGLGMYALQSFLLIFLFAFLFAFLFSDLCTWVVAKFSTAISKIQSPSTQKFARKFNTPIIVISLIYLSFITMVTLMFYSLIPQLIEETKGLIKVAPTIATQLTNAATSLQSQVNFDLGLDEAFSTLVSKENIETTVRGLFDRVTKAGIFLIQIVIALILSYVYIIDRLKIQKFTNEMKFGNFAFIHEQFSLIFEKISKSFGLLFKAQSIIALANAILTVIGLLIISFIHGGEAFPFIATIWVIVFILGFIPVFGFLISTAPIILIGFNYGWMEVVLASLVMIAFIHAVEAYYLNPKIVSSYMEFPVFVTFAILLISEHFMGFVGLLIGVPLFYILIDVLRDADGYIEKIKKISHTIDTAKITTKEAIHKNIRLSRSWKRASE